MKKNKDKIVFVGEQLHGLNSLIHDTLDEWYDAKHRKPSNPELDLINNLVITCCPYCKEKKFKKSGLYKSGIRRYRCNSCGRAFNPLTGTIFDSHKIPISEWIEYLMHLFEFHSITSSARDNRNAKSTGRYWLSKVFAVLKDCQKEVVLTGDIYLDETYFSVMPKNTILKIKNKKYAGISRNKICVASATDGKNTFIVVCGKAKPSKARISNAFKGHIDICSRLIHDGDNSHSILVKEYKMKEIVHLTKKTKHLSDKENPMNPINSVHRNLKTFMRQHPGYKRENLQDWLNLFWFICQNRDNGLIETIRRFLEIAISTHKVIRFREFYKKSSE